jgi:hypothetical protein
MRAHSVSAIAALLLLLGVASGAAASTSRAASTDVHRGTCSVDLPGYGAVNGGGTLVTTTNGQLVFVCNFDLSSPPTGTVVETFPGTGGNVVVVSVSGQAVVVFTPSA